MTDAPRSIDAIRQAYEAGALHREDLDPDPIKQFAVWFKEAEDSGLQQPNAMALATVGADGSPAVRTVLLKGFDDRGFVFFTNYTSDKAGQIAANPRGEVCFFWETCRRMVRVAGPLDKVDRAETEAYFATRPRDSQLGAWASDQSAVVESRAVLEQRFAEVEHAYQGKDVPCPPHWGGYRLVHETVEVWEGRPGRLHDRLRYRRGDSGAGGWVIDRVCP